MIDVSVFTDGSSSDNGKPHCIAGWAMVIPNFNGKMFVRYGHLPAPSSNNKGEILGVLYAMSLFHHQSRFRPIIHSDSQYVVNSCNKWRHKWKLTNYDGIKNSALLLPLFDFIEKDQSNHQLLWVKGHAGLHGNELADEFCAKGKRKEAFIKRDNVSDIVYVPHEDLPYDLLQQN